MIPIKLESYLKKNKGIMVNIQASCWTDTFNSELVDVETGKQLLVGSGRSFADALTDIADKISVDEI